MKAVEAGMDFQALKRGRTLGERRKKEVYEAGREGIL
jgi:hypothetical protein